VSELFASAVLNYLTPITVVVAMLLPSLWASGAVGATVAIIGVVYYSGIQPDSQIVAAWMIAQCGIAVGINLLRRRRI